MLKVRIPAFSNCFDFVFSIEASKRFKEFETTRGNLLKVVLFLLLGSTLTAQSGLGSEVPSSIHFIEQKVASENYESVGVFDVNNDDIPDIVSGAFWYEGPSLKKKHPIGGPKRYGEYYDHFSTIPLDVNGDGRMDFVTGGWFGKQLVWKENTGNTKEWPEHLIDEVGNIETIRAWDIDGDGIMDIVPNTPNDPLVVYRLITDNNGKGTGTFEKFRIVDQKQGHGLGFGDINGDGRADLIIPNGWLEAPENLFEKDWKLHLEFDFGTASVPILVVDVNADGLNDIIVGQGHDYGLHWYEQKPESRKNGKWQKHTIDPFNSQYHTMEWEDLDGDGQEELITGKRFMAHNGKDPGGYDPIGLYYFRWNGENFSKQVIDYGAYGEGKGTGVYFQVSDINADGRKDIIVPGKDGLSVYYNNL
ncbi:FG-GAP repeat domain-containing protein [Pareuzebyella sediminis]|uniref:FG-GAP repeat domain-containing protein n=1 Tax=Pareuzebyella sediminis TaxID=2607998 RepID=UPI0011EC6745|nr:VCBS repeat-containing protein [Pareuzebyella sediminis]